VPECRKLLAVRHQSEQFVQIGCDQRGDLVVGAGDQTFTGVVVGLVRSQLLIPADQPPICRPSSPIEWPTAFDI